MATLTYRRANEVKLDYASRISPEVWSQYETVIRWLHAQNNTKNDIVQRLGEVYDFHPTIGQLNVQTRKWGLKVYGVRKTTRFHTPARKHPIAQCEEATVYNLNATALSTARSSAAAKSDEAESKPSVPAEAQKATSAEDSFTGANILPWLNQLGYAIPSSSEAAFANDPPLSAFQAVNTERFHADDPSGSSDYLEASESALFRASSARPKSAVTLDAQGGIADHAPESQTLRGKENENQLPFTWEGDDEPPYDPSQDGRSSSTHVEQVFAEPTATRMLFDERSEASSVRAFRTMAIRLKGKKTWVSRKSSTSMSIDSRDSWSINGVAGLARSPTSTTSNSKRGLLNLRPTKLATEDWNTLQQHLHFRFIVASDPHLHLDPNEANIQLVQDCCCGNIECTAEANFPCAAQVLQIFRESLNVAEQKSTQTVIPRGEHGYALRQSMQLSTQYIHARLKLIMDAGDAEWNGDEKLRDEMGKLMGLAEGNVKGLFFGIEHLPDGHLVDTSRLILFSERIRRDVLLALFQYMEIMENRTTEVPTRMECD